MTTLTMSDIRSLHKQAGGYFFSRETMKFWGSKIYPTVYKGNLFVTSEYTGFERTHRAFSVRQFNPNDPISIQCIKLPDGSNTFNKFSTLESARDFAKNYFKD